MRGLADLWRCRRADCIVRVVQRFAPTALSSVALCVALITVGCQTKRPGQYSIEARVPATGAVVPLEVDQRYLFLSVRVNGAGPFRFMFDTGSQLDLVRPEVLEAAGLKRIEGVSLKLNDTTGHWMSRGAAFTIGEAVYQPSVIGVTEFLERVSQMHGMRVDGVIGAGLLARLNATIDYERATLTLRPQSSAAAVGEGPKMAAQVTRGLWHLPVAFDLGDEARGTNVFLLDTGFRGSIALDARYLQTAGIQLNTNQLTERMSVAVGGMNPGFYGRASSVRVDDTTLTNVVFDTGLLSKAGIGTNQGGMIGAELLRRFTIETDSRSQTIALRPNSALNEPYPVDQTGLLVSARGSDYKELQVDWVRPNSPADAAGLRAGDWLRHIDSRPARDWKLSAFRERLTVLSSQIPLQIERDGETKETAIRPAP